MGRPAFGGGKKSLKVRQTRQGVALLERLNTNGNSIFGMGKGRKFKGKKAL